ncbi:MAG: ribbon-helix-helix domain-containing protein [Qipengyuania sp.]|nr:ribbon-helix-helix domain-containing protein [Sphingomonas sp.]MBX9896586.1 ribbon-helix-helix domain-containing protein [Qipengyuania sp.]
MAPRSSRKEFRTSVILTEGQFKRVREMAQANDASIAWVLRQAVDRYLEAQGAASMDRGDKPPETTQVR